MDRVTRHCFKMFLALAVLGGCASRGEPEGKLPLLEQRLTEEDLARLLPKGTPAGAVRELFGTPARAYVSAEGTETWEYRLTGFQHPRTLYVELGGGQQVTDVYVLERRGATTRPSALHR